MNNLIENSMKQHTSLITMPIYDRKLNSKKIYKDQSSYIRQLKNRVYYGLYIALKLNTGTPEPPTSIPFVSNDTDTNTYFYQDAVVYNDGPIPQYVYTYPFTDTNKTNTFTLTEDTIVNILIVDGGNCGNENGNGGDGGDIDIFTNYLLAAGTYNVIVGKGSTEKNTSGSIYIYTPNYKTFMKSIIDKDGNSISTQNYSGGNYYSGGKGGQSADEVSQRNNGSEGHQCTFLKNMKYKYGSDTEEIAVNNPYFGGGGGGRISLYSGHEGIGGSGCGGNYKYYRGGNGGYRTYYFGYGNYNVYGGSSPGTRNDDSSAGKGGFSNLDNNYILTSGGNGGGGGGGALVSDSTIIGGGGGNMSNGTSYNNNSGVVTQANGEGDNNGGAGGIGNNSGDSGSGSAGAGGNGLGGGGGGGGSGDGGSGIVIIQIRF